MQQDPRDRFRISRNDTEGHRRRQTTHRGNVKQNTPTAKKVTPRLHLKTRIAAIVRQLARFLKQYKKICMGLLILVLVIGGVVAARQFFGSGSPSSTGRATQQNQEGSGADSAVQVVETPEFSVLRPAGNQDVEIRQISPPGNEPVYAFIDTLDGARVRISQQELPESFKSEQAAKLEELAESFQAGSVIQIDDSKVYHGFSEKNGGVQSLVFIREERLFLVAADKKLSDDTWVAYITSLK